MAPYSMDPRSRVLRDADAGLPSKDIAVTDAVGRSWGGSRQAAAT